MTPGTECPAEMNFYFPDHRALCMAENATHNLHNLLTLRGAQVRDPRIWSRYLAEAIELFARDSRRRRSPRTTGRPGAPRPSSSYLDRAARPLRLPARPDPAADQPGLRRTARSPRCSRCRRRSTRPGTPTATTARSTTTSRRSTSATSGWYDAQPGAPLAAPARGGGQALRGGDGRHRRHRRARPRSSRADGDLRFAAELASHAVFAEPGPPSRPRGAGRGPGAARLRRRERDVAQRLPHRRPRAAHRHDRAHRRQQRRAGARPDRHPAVRLRRPSASSGSKAWERVARRSPGTLTDSGEHYRMELSNGALIHHPTAANAGRGPDRHAHRSQLLALLAPGPPTASTWQGTQRPRRG